MKTRPSEKGAALFAVLALLMLLAGFVTVGLDRLRAATTQISDGESRAQALALAQAGVEAAHPLIPRLKALARQNPAQFRQPIAFDLGGGHVVLHFADAGACFNLNSLAPGANDKPPQTRPEQFARMLAATGISPMETGEIARATADYLAHTGMLWADPGEWLAVPGITAEHWAAAGGLLCALPNREATSFNVNMLTPEQAPLLVAVGLEVDEARRALAGRPHEGWVTTNDFWDKASPAGTPETAGAQVVGTSSRWISLHVTATSQGMRLERLYLLDTISSPARIASSVWLPVQGAA